LAVDLYRQRKHTVAEICRTVGISKPMLYAYVREAGINHDRFSTHLQSRSTRAGLRGFLTPWPER